MGLPTGEPFLLRITTGLSTPQCDFHLDMIY
jgi:hypothetical protein